MMHRIEKVTTICWAIHLLTASGLVFGLGALLAISNHHFPQALFLIVITMIIDGVDGPLARHFDVKKHIPNFDGTLLDNIVDYFTWVILPSYFLIEAQLMPYGLSFFGASLILLIASYQFCCSDVKSCKSTFKRWPSAWSLVIFFMYVWQTPAILNLIAVLFFVALSFMPIYYIHPFQKNVTLSNSFVPLLLKVSAIALTGSMLYSVIIFPTQLVWLTLAQQAGILMYFLLCFYQTRVFQQQSSLNQ